MMKKCSLICCAVTVFSLALVACFVGSSSLQAAGAPEISKKQVQVEESLVYPTPQKMTLKNDILSVLKWSIKSLKADKDALRVIGEISKSETGGVSLIIGNKDNHALARYAKDIPDVVGAYKLIIASDKIILVGHDDAGQFYGAQTLSQMVKQGGTGFTLPQGEIIDWPDIPFRGTVEGFYGKPWGFEDRISQLKFYGKYKLNTYIYGPKDDPFHGFSTRWREPYPEAQAKKMQELVKVAKENKVNFIWAVHPGRDIKWTEQDRIAALKKYQMMYDLGVRSFGVFFDDIGGAGASAEGQAEFLNFLNREFIKKKPDVTPLVMCPTEYNKSWANKEPGTYLDILGDKLDKDIDIMWTGDSVVADVTTDTLSWVNNRIKRSAYIWWNFPASDFVRHMLLLGRIYGLEKGTQKHMSGFVSNPMDKPEASKIALFGIADFTWNQNAFDSPASWMAGIKRLFPKCARAMQTFANHNSDHGPNGHGYRREESVVIAPVVQECVEALSLGKPAKSIKALPALREEFVNIQEAPELIFKNVNNPALVAEIEPWLAAFKILGDSGISALNYVDRAQDKMKLKESLNFYLDAADALAQIDYSGTVYAKKINAITGDHWQTMIKTGTLVMRPAVEKILQTGNALFYSSLSGRPLKLKTPFMSTKNLNGIEKMLDSNPQSYFYCQEILKIGDYCGVDLGSSQEITSVSIVMGRNDNDSDAIHKGQLEISQNGVDWTPLMPESSGLTVNYEGKGKKGRFVRYRATVAGIPNGKADVWTAYRNFSVNGGEKTSMTVSNIVALNNLQMDSNDKGISIVPLLEVVPMEAKDYFGLVLPDAPFIGEAEFDFKKPDMEWATCEVTMDGKTWEAKSWEKKDDKFIAFINSPIKGIRVINRKEKKEDINIAKFQLNFSKDGAASTGAAIDENLMTYFVPQWDGAQPVEIKNMQAKVNFVTILSNGIPHVEILICDGSGNWKSMGKVAKFGCVANISLKGIKQPIKAIGFKGKDMANTDETPFRVFEVIWK